MDNITTSTTASRPLSTIEPFSNYLSGHVMGHRPPISATAFHPHRMMLACSAVGDGHVSLFKVAGRDGSVTQNGTVKEWDA